MVDFDFGDISTKINEITSTQISTNDFFYSFQKIQGARGKDYDDEVLRYL